MQQRPSKKQRELLSFLDGFIKGNGYGPSYREIMRALDYKSVSTVAVHINGLIARGWLVKRAQSARSLELVKQSESAEVKPVSKTVEDLQKLKQKLEKNKAGDIDIKAVDRTIELFQETVV